MQAPEDSATSGSIYSPEPSDDQPQLSYHQWLNNSWLNDGETAKGPDRQAAQKSYRQWQLGSALTGTAVVSAGLAAPFVGEQAISVPVGESYFSTAQSAGLTEASANDRHSVQTVAFSKGQAIPPTVSGGGQAPQAFFSHSSQTGFDLPASSNDILNSVSPLTEAPQLTPNALGGWSLTYGASTDEATQLLATQAVVNQLVTQNRNQLICSGRSCRGLDYIETHLPAAEQTLTELQQQLAAFETQYGQRDLKAYQKVLSERISEITTQKTQIAIALAETHRYIGQLKVRLTTIGAASTLPEQLLAIDTDYQTQWLSLQRIERQLLEEFSQANVDGTALNQIYLKYEQQQLALYQSAQSVLGNYLLATESQSTPSPLLVEPAALDLLQQLTVALHQQDVQQLRDRTVQRAQERLQLRHRELAQNISEYESLQREAADATAVIAQYTQERARIIAASDAVLVANAADSLASDSLVTDSLAAEGRSPYQASSAIAVAESLESQLPEGTLGKTLLAIAIAAGAMAVAVQRRAGDVSAALSLEIAPRSKQNDLGFSTLHKRISNPIQPELIAELIEITRPAQPVLAVQGAPFGLLAPASQDNGQRPSPQLAAALTADRLSAAPTMQTTAQTASAHNDLKIDSMARELEELVSQSQPEIRFAREVEQRNVDPVWLNLDEIDAFAESAVRWVLQDITGHAAIKVRETVDA